MLLDRHDSTLQSVLLILRKNRLIHGHLINYSRLEVSLSLEIVTYGFYTKFKYVVPGGKWVL